MQYLVGDLEVPSVEEVLPFPFCHPEYLRLYRPPTQGKSFIFFPHNFEVCLIVSISYCISLYKQSKQGRRPNVCHLRVNQSRINLSTLT